MDDRAFETLPAHPSRASDFASRPLQSREGKKKTKTRKKTRFLSRHISTSFLTQNICGTRPWLTFRGHASRRGLPRARKWWSSPGFALVRRLVGTMRRTALPSSSHRLRGACLRKEGFLFTVSYGVSRPWGSEELNLRNWLSVWISSKTSRFRAGSSA